MVRIVEHWACRDDLGLLRHQLETWPPAPHQVGMPTLAHLADRLLAAGHKADLSTTLSPTK